MGKKQSTLKGFVIEKEDALIATKENEDGKFLIKKIDLNQISSDAAEALTSEIKTLTETSHPHIVSCKNSVEEDNIYYVVMDYCQGGTLDTKIQEMKLLKSPKESEALNWIVEICIALKTIHEKGLLHKDLMSENVFLTEFGFVCLGGFGKIHENSQQILTSSTNSAVAEKIHHLAPEVFTDGNYDAKSDIWSLGCILYELCTEEPAFSAETTIKLLPKIIGGPYPSLSENFSADLHDLVNDIFQKDPHSRPTASEILERPFIIRCLTTKTKTKIQELQKDVDLLRALADGLERVHQGTTIGSLAGGVIGAAGGITSIVGLILAPFTFGASLIVTGVGVGVGVLGGATAGVSNITNMVNQSTDRKAVRTIIRGIEQKIKAVLTWLQEISNSLQTIRSKHGTYDPEDKTKTNVANVCLRTGRGLGGVAELVRLVQFVNVGRIAAQASRLVRVAEVATGVLSGLFVAVDIFFIAMDAKEIHHIKQAQMAGQSAASGSRLSLSETGSTDALDNAKLLIQDAGHATPESQDQKPSYAAPVRSELMRFVQSIRKAADDLQELLVELDHIVRSIPSLRGDSELEFEDMELM